MLLWEGLADTRDWDDLVMFDSWEKLSSELSLPYIQHGEIPRYFRGEVSPTIISAGSDYGLSWQAKEHPNADLWDLAQTVDWQLVSRRREYTQVPIGPACVPENCNPLHAFSLKTDRFTWGTFGAMPEGLSTWFCTNANIIHPKVRLLPFGLSTDGPGSSYLPESAGATKEHLLYVNFQDNTQQRLRLKSHYSRQPWATTRMTANMPVRDYQREVAASHFVLCPRGCGLDTHRLWESLALGSIPIIERSNWASMLSKWGLPVVVMDNLFGITPALLEEITQEMVKQTYSLEAMTISYWREELKRECQIS